MTADWKQSYVGQLRQLVGNKKLIIPSVRAFIQNSKGEVLYIKRRGSGKWALPAGGIEYDESIFECLRREVEEETGLLVRQATLISVYTEPKYSVRNTYGDEYQGFEFLFRVDHWDGINNQESNETSGIGFFSIDNLPEFESDFWEEHEREVIEDIKNFQGIPFIK